MTPQRVTLITLGVADLARARTFYAALGWAPADGAEAVSFYQMHGAALALFRHDDLAADQGRTGAALGHGAIALAQNFATRAEVDAAYALALSAGATPLKPPESVFWGGYSGYYADPDGHVWEMALNPFWPLAPDGSLTLPGAIETLAEADLDRETDRAIATLLQQAFDTEFDGRSFFQQRHHWRHLIRADGQVIAHVAVQLRAVRLGGRLITVAGLAEVATDALHRGQGHAAQLVRAAIDKAAQGPAQAVILFGDAPVYSTAGFRRMRNPLLWTDLRGARTGATKREPAEVLMVLPLNGTIWDDTAELDMLGGLM